MPACDFTAKAGLKKSGIYCIRNRRNGKRYIGSAAKLSRRWTAHRHALKNNSHCSPHLQQAWNKNVGDAFVFEVLFYCDKDDLLFYEQRALDAFRSHDPKQGYNISPVAGSSLGVKHSTETRSNMSAGQKRRFASPESRARMSAIRKAAWENPDSRARMKASQARTYRRPDIMARRLAALARAKARRRSRSKAAAANQIHLGFVDCVPIKPQ